MAAQLTLACDVQKSLKNTSVGCNILMGAPAQTWLLNPALTWTDNDLLDFETYIKVQMHNKNAFPVNGLKAPIRNVNSTDASPVTVTYQDGSVVQISAGYANQQYQTNAGGYCYANALASFIGSGFLFIQVDKAGKVLMNKVSDGVYSGFPANYSTNITPANFQAEALISFGISYDPTVFYTGKVFSGGLPLLGYAGLEDVKLITQTGSTTSSLKIGALDDCTLTDLVKLLGSAWANVNLYVVTNASGVAQTPTSVTVNATTGVISINFTTPLAAGTYSVKLAAPSVLYTNSLTFIEGKNTLSITV